MNSLLDSKGFRLKEFNYEDRHIYSINYLEKNKLIAIGSERSFIYFYDEKFIFKMNAIISEIEKSLFQKISIFAQCNMDIITYIYELKNGLVLILEQNS